MYSNRYVYSIPNQLINSWWPKGARGRNIYVSILDRVMDCHLFAGWLVIQLKPLKKSTIPTGTIAKQRRKISLGLKYGFRLSLPRSFSVATSVKYTNFTNTTMHLSQIPRCSKQDRNVHIGYWIGAFCHLWIWSIAGQVLKGVIFRI